MNHQLLRGIPAVEKVLQALGETRLPRPAVGAVVRRELAALRSAKQVPGGDAVIARIRAALDTLARTRIQTVINGTGVLVHTNLGRAPLGPAAAQTLTDIATNYNNLEFDLGDGQRGTRGTYLEHNLALLCGAQSATAVNNCAAALILILRHFLAPPRHEVIISRGELVQIGGGFRIPEILEASGATLREVGTTNQTSLGDYAKAIRRETAMILKVHRSNFFMDGFVASPTTADIAVLARRKRVPFIEDLGSGAVVATEKLAALEHEPTPAEVLRRGADLVCFSGDKLFGGPQAGLIAGKARFVAALKREPFFRALRCDKLVLSALQITVDAHLAGSPDDLLPVLAMLRVSCAELRARADKLTASLAGLSLRACVGEARSQVGGGALPRSTVPSVALELMAEGLKPVELAARLRRASPPVLGYVAGGRFKLDLRTIFPRQDEAVVQVIRWAVTHATHESS